MTTQSKVEEFIEQWKQAPKTELRARLKTLKCKRKSSSVIAEIKAITALLS